MIMFENKLKAAINKPDEKGTRLLVGDRSNEE